MQPLEPPDYPLAIGDLWRVLPLAPLGPGTPRQEFRPRLEAVGSAFPASANPAAVAACRAGLWLAFDFLDEAHETSQTLDTPEGSYWHAIVHRREPDPSNAKYWFRRVGDHLALRPLREQAPTVGYQFTDPFTFIDFVERVRGSGGADEELARRVQKLEWELLFDHCCRLATR